MLCSCHGIFSSNNQLLAGGVPVRRNCLGTLTCILMLQLGHCTWLLAKTGLGSQQSTALPRKSGMLAWLSLQRKALLELHARAEEISNRGLRAQCYEIGCWWAHEISNRALYAQCYETGCLVSTVASSPVQHCQPRRGATRVRHIHVSFHCHCPKLDNRIRMREESATGHCTHCAMR